MLNLRVILSYLHKFQNLADAAPGFVSGGIAPSLSAIETLPHGSFSNTYTGMEFDELQRDLIEKKRKKRSRDKRKQQ